MLPTIAIIADVHISDFPGTAQDAALAWACSTAQEKGADILLCLGDLTTVGTAVSAAKASRFLGECNITTLHTPGNAELRSPEDAETVHATFTTATPITCKGITFLGIDSSAGAISTAERDRVERELNRIGPGGILLTHWPPTALPEEDSGWFERMCRTAAPTMLVAGHKHQDGISEFGGVPLHVFRGLDPDKARYAQPALGLLAHDGNSWQRRDISFPAADPRLWKEREREDFFDLLGISTMLDTVNGLQEAAVAAVPCVEIKASDAARHPSRSLQKGVSQWRNTGGRILSVHLPNVQWDTDNSSLKGLDSMLEAIDLACDLGANRVTAHVPRTTVEELSQGSPVREYMLEAHCQCFDPIAKKGIEVGIENLHMGQGEVPDSRRGFGYLPEECLGWITDLRKRLPQLVTGMHLDIGHARNNGPFANVWPLGGWYAKLGPEVNGYHVHQVVDGKNHQPIDNPYGPSISLASFFWAWSTGQLAHAPVFLEIRTESGIRSWHSLKTFMNSVLDATAREVEPKRGSREH